MTLPRLPLDTAPIADVVDRVLTAQQDALAAVRAVAPQLAAAADLVTGRFAAGGRLLLVAPPGPAARVVDLAVPDLVREFGLADGAVERRSDLADRLPTARDAVLVVATVRTPAVEAALRVARDRRAGLVLLTTAAASAADADVVVAPAVGPEPVRDLHRLGAATALKAALDAVTTAVVAHLGHVHGDLPVDLVADSGDDRERAVAMVAELAGVDEATARRAATATGCDIRAAVVALTGGLEPSAAAVFAGNRRSLRDALADLPRRSAAGVGREAPRTAGSRP